MNKWENLENHDQIQMLINDRIGFVTDRLGSVSRQNHDETIFDLMMLFFDSLNEKREIILKIWDSVSFNQQLICEGQSQLLNAIDNWHQELNINWQVGKYIQNLLFLLCLVYLSAIWKDDNSADSSKVMAKVDEIIKWLNSSKSSPFDVLQKLKNLI
jgi:hypothetical protein